MDAYKFLMQNEFGGARSRDRNFTDQKWQKVDEFEPIYLGNNRNNEKRFVIFKHTINHLSFGCVCLLQLEYYFSCFASFLLLFFSFSFTAIYV